MTVTFRDRPQVLVLMGSASDKAHLESCCAILRDLEIPFALTVASAHRTPDRVHDLVRSAEDHGVRVFIAAAGAAAHLAGVVASLTLRPVIGVPVPGRFMGGLDALLATVQMPGGIPVATVAAGSGGPKNAALLAAQILAIGDPDLQGRLVDHRRSQGEAVVRAAASLDLPEALATG